MTEESTAKVRYAFRHPIQWLRGDNLQPENITPFECATQLLSRGLSGFMDGFTESKKRNFLYFGTGEGKVTPAMTSVTGVIASTWDAINDPLVGTYMDTHPWKMRTHLMLMRANAAIKPFFSLFNMLNLGLSPLTRVIVWLATGIIQETFETFSGVSSTKFMAGVTPYSRERSKLQNWNNMGRFMGAGLSSIPMLLMGLRGVLGITDYQIFLIGGMITLPFCLTGNLLPSFMRQRVEFPAKPAPDKYRGEKPLKRAWLFVADTARGVAHSFSIMRHNGWFVRNIIAGFITIFTPSIDSMYFYRFLVQPIKIFGKEFKGEGIFSLKNSTITIPGTLLMPFARKAIQRVGSEKNMVLLNHAVKVVTYLLRYLVGYKTFPRLLFMYLMEMIEDIPHHWVSVATGVIDYEMLDYVEWKTGVRSEGVNMAVSAMTTKLVTNNVGQVINNAIMQWSGFLGTTDKNGRELTAVDQPKRFLNIVWPLICLCPVFDETVYFLFRVFWKPPAGREQMEKDLIERRALAKKLLDNSLL
ncbi:MAG: MFS transporter [Oscillospiraceae bacterium]|nr:MFS transporter [Oscillospiraceae bacterium]